MCASEALLNSSFESNNKDLITEGYNLIKSEHSSNTKRGGVSIYYKEFLVVRVATITSSAECLFCEVTIENKKRRDAGVYRSFSQSLSECESFLSSFADLFSNIFCYILLAHQHFK